MSGATSKTGSTAGIRNRFQINLKVDGNAEGINTQANGFSTLLTANVRQKLPVVMLRILDINQMYEHGKPINDGTALTLAFNDGSEGLSAPWHFRSYGTPVRLPHPSGFMELIVYGLLDNMAYLTQTVNRSFVGSSTAVMQNIASLLNFQYKTNDNTQDSMTWLPGPKTWYKFAQHVANHAYSDDHSVFSVGVDADQTLYFINITKQFANQKVKTGIYYGAAPPQNSSLTWIPALRAKAINRSGMLNHQGAYGMVTTQTGEDGSPSTFTEVSASRNTQSNFDISRNVSHNALNRSKMQIAPVGMQNTYGKFIQARHQNRRLKKTYSQNVYVLLPYMSGLKLYDLVQVKMAMKGHTQSSVSGVYCVTGISKGIYSSNYCEKLELTTTGPNNANPLLF